MALWRFSFSIAVDNMAPFLPFRFRIFRLDFVARVYTAPHIHFDDYGLVIVALRFSSIFLSLPPTGSLSLFLFPRWAMAKSICMDSTCVCFLSINFNYDKLIRVSIYLLSSPLLLMVFSAKHPLQHIILILLLTTAARNTYTHTHMVRLISGSIELNWAMCAVRTAHCVDIGKSVWLIIPGGNSKHCVRLWLCTRTTEET